MAAMAASSGGARLNRKDLKRFKKILEENKKTVLNSAKKTLSEELVYDTDDLPDEIDQASSEYNQSLAARLRDREKFLLRRSRTRWRGSRPTPTGSARSARRTSQSSGWRRGR